MSAGISVVVGNPVSGVAPLAARAPACNDGDWVSSPCGAHRNDPLVDVFPLGGSEGRREEDQDEGKDGEEEDMGCVNG